MSDDLTAPGTFNFLEVITGDGRGYPKDQIKVSLDEATAYKIATSHNPEELDGLYDKLKASEYTFHLTGTPEALSVAVLDYTVDILPRKYDTSKNFITGQVEKVEKDSPERDRLYTNLLWAAHIEKIVAPDGSEDTFGLDLDLVEAAKEDGPARQSLTRMATVVDAFRLRAPGSQVERVWNAITKLQVSASAFEAEVSDPDF